MCSVFDNEEVGSGTKQGAGSTFGADVLKIQCCSEIYDRRKIGSAGKGSLHLCGADQR